MQRARSPRGRGGLRGGWIMFRKDWPMEVCTSYWQVCAWQWWMERRWRCRHREQATCIPQLAFTTRIERWALVRYLPRSPTVLRTHSAATDQSLFVGGMPVGPARRGPLWSYLTLRPERAQRNAAGGPSSTGTMRAPRLRSYLSRYGANRTPR